MSGAVARKPLGRVIPIRIPLNADSEEIEIPIRLTLAISFYRVKKISEEQEMAVGELMPKLTCRQNQVLTGILEDKPNKQIANELNLSVRTVKFYVTQLLSLFDVDTRMELRTAICGKANL